MNFMFHELSSGKFSIRICIDSKITKLISLIALKLHAKCTVKIFLKYSFLKSCRYVGSVPLVLNVYNLIYMDFIKKSLNNRILTDLYYKIHI